MLVEYLSDIYQCFIVLECQFVLYQTFKSLFTNIATKTSLLYIYCNGVVILVEYLSDIYQCFIVLECQLFLYRVRIIYHFSYYFYYFPHDLTPIPFIITQYGKAPTIFGSGAHVRRSGEQRAS